MKTKNKSEPANAQSEPTNAQPEPKNTHFSGDSGIVIGKNRGSKLLKVLGSKSKSDQRDSPLGWLLNPDVNSDTLKLMNSWHTALHNKSFSTRLAEEVIQSIQTVSDQPKEPGDAVLVLAACHALGAVGKHGDAADWQQLVSHLLKISVWAESNVDLAPQIYQQLAIEVPLTIAFQIPEIEDHHQLAVRNWQKMTRMITEMLDHDGWPQARYLSSFGPLVASWVRCCSISSELNFETGFDAASQLEWMVRQVLRMLRPDRTLVFSGQYSKPATKSFLKLLLKLSSDPKDKRLLKTVFSKSSPAVNAKQSPGAANISQWSESAVLQSGWGMKTPKVAVDFSGKGCWAEICRKVNLIQGDATPEVAINGVALVSDEPFEVAGTESDSNVDYLELEKDLGNGVTLNRQFLLSRKEEFLLIGDAIVPESGARIDYRCGWPLAPGVAGLHESETREVYLTGGKKTGGKIQSLVLPLALPEWKVGRTDDRLEVRDGKLSLIQSIDGSGLYAPLFFDLNPKRSKRKRTWRQLTVAEDFQKIARDMACAYRVQLNEQQWIFYRMVSSKGMRTFMGEHINADFFFARFKKNGSVVPLIEIE